MTNNLHQTYVAIIVELAVDDSGNTSTIQTLAFELSRPRALGALTQSALFMGIFPDRLGGFRAPVQTVAVARFGPNFKGLAAPLT